MPPGKRSRDDGGEPDVAERILERLGAYELGVHDLGDPGVGADPTLPLTLLSVYHRFDGGRLFHEAIQLLPYREVEASVERSPGGGARWRVGEAGGDAISVDERGRVWREDGETGEVVLDGTAFDRWLLGAIEAEAMLFERDGEFRDDIFDDDGDLLPAIALAQLRAPVKRDPRAPGPRWRLARHLTETDDLPAARRELEEVVAAAPDFPWAWLDLARLSERLGELAGAVDEAVAAADADPSHELVGFFLAHAARFAAASNDEPTRAELAGRAVAASSDLVRSFRDGAETNLAEGDVISATELAELAAAIAPRDLAVLDLLARVRAADTAS
jgi:tetratricopeptide (TPR) repeat protein